MGSGRTCLTTSAFGLAENREFLLAESLCGSVDERQDIAKAAVSHNTGFASNVGDGACPAVRVQYHPRRNIVEDGHRVAADHELRAEGLNITRKTVRLQRAHISLGTKSLNYRGHRLPIASRLIC
jgi:hypothetical protein